MKNKKLLSFYFITIFLSIAANCAHPVTPTLIVERNLDSSMFGVALAAMMVMNFLFSPFWGRLGKYIPTKTILLIGGIGYSVGQLIFGLAQTEAAIIGARMFAGIFCGATFTALPNYVINFSDNNPAVRGRNLTTLATLQNVAGACGYFIGGMLGLISVNVACFTQAAILGICGIMYFILCSDDTALKPKPDKPLSIKEANPFSSFILSKEFMTPMLALVFIIVAVSAIGQNSYEQCFNYYIKDQYGMSSAYNGMFKAGIAVLTVILNSTVCLYIQKKTDINITFIWIISACTALLLGILLFRGQILFIVTYIVYSAVNAIRLPIMQSLIANRSTTETSNSMMGFYQSMTSLGGIFGALFAGLIYAKGAMLPFILAFAAFALSVVIGLVYIAGYKKNKN